MMVKVALRAPEPYSRSPEIVGMSLFLVLSEELCLM